MSDDRRAPVFYVKLVPEGGSEERVDLTGRVLSFVYDDDEAKADKLTLTIDNFDLSQFDVKTWRKGNKLEVSWGYVGRVTPVRETIITTVKGSKVLTVEALAKSILMNRVQKTRVFENMKRSDVVAQVAEENGYDATRQFIDDTEIVFPVISQAKVTDAQLLKSLAQKEGFQFFVDYDGLHWHQRKLAKRPSRTWVYYNDPRDNADLIDWSLESDVAAKPGAVTAKGRDPLKKKDIEERADDPSTKRDTLAPILEVVDEKTGASSLQTQVAAESTIASSAPSSDAAKREAKGKFIASQQTAVQLKLDCIGDPDVAAKQIHEVQGISIRLSGRYYVKNAKHTLSGTEYKMELAVRADGAYGASGAPKPASSSGDQNTQSPTDKDALTAIESIDQRSGASSTTYAQKSGGG